MPLPTDSNQPTAIASTFSPRTVAAAGTTTKLRSAFALGLAALTACGGGDLLLPQDGEPAHISALRGDNQTGTVGQSLSDSLVVKVTDSGDRPVADVEVTFFPPAGGEVAPNATVRTASNG